MRFGREVWLGMLAPLVVVGVTWVLIERVYKADPERLTSVMIGAFAGKLVFFGAYVGLAIGVLGVRAGAVRRELRRLLHRAAHDRGALVEAPVCFLRIESHAGSRTRDAGDPRRSPGRWPWRRARGIRRLQRRRNHHQPRLEQLARPSADSPADDCRDRLLGHQARLHAVAGRRARLSDRDDGRPALSAIGPAGARRAS